MLVATRVVARSRTGGGRSRFSIDYTYDLPASGGTNFFGSGNPQGATGGAQAKAALEAAANFYSIDSHRLVFRDSNAAAVPQQPVRWPAAW